MVTRKQTAAPLYNEQALFIYALLNSAKLENNKLPSVIITFSAGVLNGAHFASCLIDSCVIYKALK